MAGRVHRLFERYSARHLRLAQRGPELHDAQGRQIGQIDRIFLRNDRLVVEGRCRADHVGLQLAGRQRVQVPGVHASGEEDDGGPSGGGPSGHNGGGHNGGGRFRLALPFAPGTPVFSLSLGDWTRITPLPVFSAARLKLGRLALWPRFGIASLYALPAGYRWLRYHDMGARARVKKLLGLGAIVEEMQLDPAVLPRAAPLPLPPRTGPGTGVTIILPVYQAFALLPEVLDRVRRHTDLPWRLIVIEDASPDPEVRPFLRDWAGCQNAQVPEQASPQVTLLENPVNLGFIGSVNRALALVAGQAEPVILLNADALVPAGWASRLTAPLLSDAGVASVTPMSNDAELMSVPVICARVDLPDGAGDAIDAVARRLGPHVGSQLPEAPTGVGFCMAINPRFLALLPGFDPAFGRGYGEEVDWCQKVRQLNGRHLCLPSLFVEHRGGASFGTVEKQALLRQNGALISARHPRFDGDVQRFIGDDPLVTARLALGLVWAGAQAGAGAANGRVPIFLAHAMGGGAEHYLRRRVGRDMARHGAAVVLRVGGDYRWDITLHSPVGVTRGCTNDRALMLHLLRLLPARDVIYSCGVADPDPVELPEVLLALARDGGEPQNAGKPARVDQRIEVLIHDYLPISPSYTLLDASGAFRGAPLPDKTGAGKPGAGRTGADRLVRGHDILRPDGSRVDLATWQAAWRPLLEAADEVVVFSHASRDLIIAAYPQIAPQLRVRPHVVAIPAAAGALARPAGRADTGKPVIGVLGNIGPHKGAALLVALSRRLARRREAGLVVIGHVDPAYDLARPSQVHGSYEVAQIPQLVARYGITCWLIPSIWPETFSFTTHEVLATGLPVMCFDLGAQAEAVHRAIAAGKPGAVLALPQGRADPEAVLACALRLCAADGS